MKSVTPNLLFTKVGENIMYKSQVHRALTTFKLEGEVTSLSESSQGEVDSIDLSFTWHLLIKKTIQSYLHNGLA